MARFRNGMKFNPDGGPRRQTTWVKAVSLGFESFTAAQTKTVGSVNGASLDPFLPATLIRTVGMMVISFDNNFITNQAYLGAMGGCLVREEARVASVFPDPWNDAEDDMWFVHQYFGGSLDDRVDADIRMDTNHKISSKAQRKIVQGDAIMFIGEGGGASDGFQLALMLRILLKLH